MKQTKPMMSNINNDSWTYWTWMLKYLIPLQTQYEVLIWKLEPSLNLEVIWMSFPIQGFTS